MTFGHPALLSLLAIPVMLIVNEIAGRKHHISLPFDHGDQSAGRWLARLTTAASFLPAFLLAVAILLLAAPLITAKPQQTRELTNIECVLDVSGSMESEFGDATRYDAAMLAITNFTSRRQGDAFGLTIFGNEVLEWTPLTQDTSAIRNATPFLRPETLPAQLGGTEIGKAVKFAHQKLAQRGEGSRLLILLSDGESADLDGTRAEEIGTELAVDEVVLYAIHIGDGVAPVDLYGLTGPTGGQVFAATDPAALSRVFAHVDQMQPIQLKPSESRQVFCYRPFAIVGSALLGLDLLVAFGLRYSPW
ncbi:MAG TPA: vWA domain-containing protein [Pirellulaceae bacterium]|nr:vWA domain-containing protein [Pirellulaceae bacterium]